MNLRLFVCFVTIVQFGFSQVSLRADHPIQVLKNKNGEVIHLHAGDKAREFLREGGADAHSWNLKSVVIDCNKASAATVAGFLRRHLSTLEYVHITGRESYDAEDLLQILGAINNSMVTDFRWENGKIKKPSAATRLANFRTLWARLEHLSLAGTEFGKNCFFLSELTFSKLLTLNLNQCELQKGDAARLFSAAGAFPVLETLHLEGQAHLAGTKSVMSLPELTWLSIHGGDIDNVAEIQQFLLNNDPLAQRLQSFFYWEARKKGGKIEDVNRSLQYLNKKGILPFDNIGHIGKTFQQLEQMSFVGRFFRPSSKMGLGTGSSASGMIFSSEADLEKYKSDFADAAPKQITILATAEAPLVLQAVLEGASPFHQLNAIFIAGDNQATTDRELLRGLAADAGVELHFILKPGYDPNRSIKFQFEPFMPHMPPQPPPVPKIKF